MRAARRVAPCFALSGPLCRTLLLPSHRFPERRWTFQRNYQDLEFQGFCVVAAFGLRKHVGYRASAMSATGRDLPKAAPTDFSSIRQPRYINQLPSSTPTDLICPSQLKIEFVGIGMSLGPCVHQPEIASSRLGAVTSGSSRVVPTADTNYARYVM